MDFGDDDANAGWEEVGSYELGGDFGSGLKFKNSGGLAIDELEESGSDEDDYVVKFHDDDTKKKNCCSRCCRCFWCWQLPILRLPLSPLILWNLIFLGSFVPLLILNPSEPLLANVLLRWWALALVIMCDAALLSRLAVGVIYFFGEIIVSKSARIFYYINELEWPFALLGWGAGMLITLNVWLSALEPNVFRAFHIIFIMIIVAACGRIVQIVLVKLVTSVLNKKKFWTEVASSLFRQRVLLKILGGKRKYRAASGAAAAASAGSNDASGAAAGVARTATARTLAARERLGRLVSFRGIRELYDNHRTQQHLMEILQTKKDDAELAKERRAEIKVAKAGSEASRITTEAKIDGNRIFEILDRDKKGYVVEEDLVGFFKDEDKEIRAFRLLQPPPFTKMKLSRKDVVKSVNSVYKDREKLVRNMKDRQSVAGVLSKIIAVILFVIAIIIFITLLNVDFVSFIAPFGTAVLAISFVFGSAAASAFKSLVFLIFVNPFDVGDRISVDNRMMLKVSKIALLSTTCDTPEGLRLIIPNYRLSESNIYNFSRSKRASMFIDMEIDIHTPVKLLLEFKTRIYRFLRKNKIIWDTEFGFQVRKVVQQRALIVGLWLSFASLTWARPALIFSAKTDFLIFIKEATTELNIECFGAEAKITIDFENGVSLKRTQDALKRAQDEERKKKKKRRDPLDSEDDDSDHDDDQDDNDNDDAKNTKDNIPLSILDHDDDLSGAGRSGSMQSNSSTGSVRTASAIVSRPALTTSPPTSPPTRSKKAKDSDQEESDDEMTPLTSAKSNVSVQPAAAPKEKTRKKRDPNHPISVSFIDSPISLSPIGTPLSLTESGTPARKKKKKPAKTKVQ